MATKIDIPESVLLKKGEIEDNAFSSESFEEKVIELLGDKVKQLDTSNLVAETVNTQLDTGISTNESGTFFQALSAPMVISGEQSNILESGKSKSTTEDQEERKSTIIKASTEEKPNDDVEAVSTHSECKEENEDKSDEKTTESDAENKEKELTLEKYQASTGENINEIITGQYATLVADSKEHDLNEKPKEFLSDQNMYKPTDAQEVSEQFEKEANDEKEQAPEESIKKIVFSSPDIEQEEQHEVKDDKIEVKMEQNESLHAIATDAYISTQIKSQVETTNDEVKDEEEASIPSIKEQCEENGSEKPEYEISSVNLDDKTIAILNKDQDEEKDQGANVLDKDQAEDGVTSVQSVMVEGQLEEKNNNNEVIEPEVVKAKDSIEENTEEIIYSGAAPEKIEPQSLVNVIPTDVSITPQTEPEEETIDNDEEAMKNDDVHTKESGSSMVEETCDETVSDKAETEERLDLSDSSNTASHENEMPNKDEDQELNVSEKGQAESQVETMELEGYEEQLIENHDSKISNNLSVKEACEEKVQDQEENEFTHSSVEELQEDYSVTIINDEKAIEKDTCEEMGPENVEPEVELKLSDSMAESNNKVLGTESDDVKSSQDTECEVVEETLVPYVKELNEMPRDLVKEETEDKLIDAPEESEKCENETKNKPEKKFEESDEKVEQEEEIEEISAHIEIDEKMEQNGVSNGATSDASLSTQSKPQVEATEHDEKDEEEATHVNDGQKEELDNPTITEVCGENSSEKVESETSAMKLNEKTTEVKSNDEDEENEQEVNVLEKDQSEDGVTSAQGVMIQEEFEEKNHHEPEIVEAREVIEKDTEEIIYSGATPENIAPQNVIPTDVSITTQTKPEEEAIKNNDVPSKESESSMVEKICDVTVSDKAEFEERLDHSDSSNTASHENEIPNKDEDQELNVSEKGQAEYQVETMKLDGYEEQFIENDDSKRSNNLSDKEACEEKEQDQEEDEVTHSQDEASLEKLQEENCINIKNEEKNIEKDTCEEMGQQSVETEIQLKLSDSMAESNNEVLSTLEKDQGDNDDIKSSQDTEGEVVEETLVAEVKELNETPREFVKEEKEEKSIDAQEESEKCENETENKPDQKSMESVKKIEQEEETEEISSHVEIDEKMEQNGVSDGATSDASISTQSKPPVETTEHEEKDEEEDTHVNDGQKEELDNPTIMEVCEENSSEKVEFESSVVGLNEKTTEILNEGEDEEKEEEVNVLEKDQDAEDVTIAQEVKFEGGLEKKNHDCEGNEHEVVEAKEYIEQQSLINVVKSDDGQTKESGSPMVKDIVEEPVLDKAEFEEELKLSDSSGVVATENAISNIDEDQEKEEDQENDEVTYSQDATSVEDSQAKKNEGIIIEENNDEEVIQKESCEETIPESGESEVGLKPSDNTEPSKNEALNTLEKDHGDTQGVTSSHVATCEDIRETTSGENATIVADFKELNEPREFFKEETEVKPFNAQEASEDCKNGEHEIIEDKTEESVMSIEQAEETEEISQHVIIDENMEQDVLLHDIASDASVSTQTGSSQVETTNIDEKDEEDATQSEDGQKEKYDNASINEVCEVNSSEKIEDESSTMEPDENAMKVLNKDEDEEKEQEVNMVEKDQSENAVTTQDVSIEECIEETNHHNEVTKPEVAKAEETIEKDDEEITHTNKTIEQQSLISTSPIDVGISTQTELEKEITECEENKDQEIIESDDSQTKELESPVDEEICDKTVSEKALDTSEKTQSGGDDITSSQNAATYDIKETTIGQHVSPDAYIEEETEDKSIDAQEASEHEDGANNKSEQKPEESVSGIVLETEQKEYIEEIKPSVETNEEKDGGIPTQTESQEEAIHGNEEVIDISTSSNVNQNEKEISVISKHEVQEKEQELNMSEKDQGNNEITRSHDATVVSEEDLRGISVDEGIEHELVETTKSTKEDYEVIETSVETEETIEHQTESPGETTEKEACKATSTEKNDFEEGLKLSDSSEIIINEKTITSKDEGEEEVEEKNDDVICSHNASKKEIQETTTGQNLTTLAYFDEGHDPTEITKEILEDEAKDKSIDTREATEKCENGANDETEPNPEESVNTPANSSPDVIEDCFKGDKTNLGSKAENLEAVQQAERTEDISETKYEVVSTEQMSSEPGQPKEQNDEEIQECPTETISEKTEDDITEKVDDSSHQSIEDTNDGTTKEVECFPDVTTREIEIPTVEHESNDEKNGFLDEGSNKTKEVEPQDDISSLEPSTEDTSCSENTKLECEDLPISEEQIPEVVPESNDLKLTEECLTSAATNVDEENETVAIEISSDGKPDETTDIKQDSVEEGRDVTNSEITETEEGVEDAGIQTKENAQQQGLLDVITTEVCSPTQTEPKEESFENEENNDGEAEASSDKVGSEEGVKYSDNLNTPLDENEIVSKEENLEKEQELIMSEVQCGGDDDINSEKASNEDIKETSQHATTVADLEEELSPLPKEILEAEEKDKTVDAQEVPSEQEQIVEDIQEKTEDDITKEDVVLNERTRDVEPQEDIAHTSSSEILTKHTSNPEDVKSECENLPVADLKSASEVRIPEAVPKSEESNLKEECVMSEIVTYVDEEQVTVTKEISSDQNLEPREEHKLTHESTPDDHIDETKEHPEEPHITHEKSDSLYDERDMKQEVTEENQLNTAEDCSEMVKDVFLTKEIEQVPSEIQKENETSDFEQLVENDNSSTEQTQKEIAHENIELHEEVKPASESMLEENQVDEAKSQPELSKITSENIMDDQTSESKLEHVSTKELEYGKRDMEEDVILAHEDQIKSIECQNETQKNVILTEEVAVETQADKTPSDQKELVKEREFQEPLLVGNTEVTEVKEESQTELGNTQDAEDLSCTIRPLELDINDDTEQTLTSSGEVKDDRLSESSNDEILPVREDLESSELEVNLPLVESTDSPISKTDREILEGGVTEDTKDTPILECEKKEKDEELKSDVQKPEAFLKMEMKEEQPEATNNTCETVTDGDPREMFSEGTEEIDAIAKEDVEVIAEGEVKAIEQSYQDEVTAVTVHDLLSHSDEKIVSMVPPEELISVSSEDQTNELAPKTDTTKFEHNSGSAEDKKMEDLLILQSEEKEQLEEAPVKDAQKHEKDAEPQLHDTKEATLEFVNHENQLEQKKEADENIEAAISIEDVKSSDVEITQPVMDVQVPISASTGKLEDLEVPSFMAATDEKKDLESTCERSITTEEEVSGMKQEPLELDAPLVTAATRDLEISKKDVTDDLISTGQNQPDVQKHEVAASTLDKPQHDNESKLLTQNIEASCEKGESAAKLLVPDPEDLKAIKASGSEPQCSSEVSKEETNVKDGGVKTDEENEEEDNENSGSSSEAPVMVEASKDMDVKVQKKSHNILSGVGSKVKHSIAKVKKAITGGKSSPTKSPTKETI